MMPDVTRSPEIKDFLNKIVIGMILKSLFTERIIYAQKEVVFWLLE